MTGGVRRRAVGTLLCTVTVLAAVLGGATAKAEPDPPPPAPNEAPAAPVPTVDQIVADLNRITAPDVPCQAKADVVDPGFSTDECQTIEDHLNRFNAHGYIPFTFIVTDVQPAPNDYAGATLSVTRPWSPPGPIVLMRQGNQWKITHDTAMTALDALWYNAVGRESSSGGPPLPPFSPMPGRLGF